MMRTLGLLHFFAGPTGHSSNIQTFPFLKGVCVIPSHTLSNAAVRSTCRSRLVKHLYIIMVANTSLRDHVCIAYHLLRYQLIPQYQNISLFHILRQWNTQFDPWPPPGPG